MFRNRDLVNLLSEIFGFPRKYDHGLVEVEFNCKKCDQGRNKFNMVVNTNNHVFHCWACGYKGKVEKLIYDYGNEYHKSQYKKINKHEIIISVDEKEDLSIGAFRTLKVKWNDSLNYNAAMNYLKKRKIGMNIISKWDIGYSESGKYRNRIIIPSKTKDGRVEYFIARTFFDENPKYKNPKVEKSKIIFGEKFINWNSPIFLTEGIFDAMVLYNSIPILGTSIYNNKRLLEKIQLNKSTVILAFDNEPEAKRKQIKTAKYLRNLGIKVYMIGDSCYNDISEANQIGGKSQLIEMIEKSREFDELEEKLLEIL